MCPQCRRSTADNSADMEQWSADGDMREEERRYDDEVRGENICLPVVFFNLLFYPGILTDYVQHFYHSRLCLSSPVCGVGVEL